MLTAAASGSHPRVRASFPQSAWRDIIDENKRRLDFVASVLQHDPSIAEGLDFVREKHADLLPPTVAVPSP